MSTTNFEKYIVTFFNSLETYEDVRLKKNSRNEILLASIDFLHVTNTNSAQRVYRTFFKTYWIGTQEVNNPFLELIDNMNKFESYAGRLIKKQRDHYIHSVLVFLLGLAVYIQSSKYKNAFEEYALDKTRYPDSYNTQNEEFFYRWGLASLFHDIAYPLEISLKQANNYIDFISSYPKKEDFKIKMKLHDFEKFIELPLIQPSQRHKNTFLKKYPGYVKNYHSDALAIISESISSNFSLNFNDVNKNLRKFIETMEERSFLDHGYYSAVIILRWYHNLVETTSWNPAYFYNPIADSASAIFLHNYFEHGILERFKLEPMRVKDHPLAFLLILCDNLQEWKRDNYGEQAICNEYPTDFDVSIGDSLMAINYKIKPESLWEKNSAEIDKKIKKILKVDDIFKLDISTKKEDCA